MTTSERATDLFLRGYNCAQATFASCGPALGLPEETCLTLAATFGGGLGRQASVCGAVTGALLVLGLRHGSAAVPDAEEKARVYGQVARFMTAFKTRFGSIICKELLGCDISTPEGLQAAMAKDFHQTCCVNFVRGAAEILATMAEG